VPAVTVAVVVVERVRALRHRHGVRVVTVVVVRTKGRAAVDVPRDLVAPRGDHDVHYDVNAVAAAATVAPNGERETCFAAVA